MHSKFCLMISPLFNKIVILILKLFSDFKNKRKHNVKQRCQQLNMRVVCQPYF